MNTENIMIAPLQEKPVVMKKLPRFDNVVVHKGRGITYRMFPIDAELNQKLKDYYDNAIPFEVEVGGYVISHMSIVVFGESGIDRPDVIDRLNDLLRRENGHSVPRPIDAKRQLVGNKLITGVDGYYRFEYCVALVGNPNYILVAKTV